MMLKMLDWKMIKLWPKAGAAKGGCFDLHPAIGRCSTPRSNSKTEPRLGLVKNNTIDRGQLLPVSLPLFSYAILVSRKHDLCL